MAIKRKPVDGFNLAFLDVMACGLGAVILIFILVDFKAFTSQPSTEKEKLEQELSASQTSQQALQKSLDEINQKIALERARQKDQQNANSDTNNQQDALLMTQAQLLAVIADLEQQKAALSKEVEKSASIEMIGKGEQNYITGMKIEGKHIGLLIDKSASMMGNDLLDILGKLGLSDGDKQRTPKWLRTKRVANWVLARIPQDANVTVVAFSETANRLGRSDTIKAATPDALREVSAQLDGIVPDGGTNLQQGLATLFQANPRITDVYLITDGLPTLGDGLPLRCTSFISTKKSISSECRQALFVETVKRARQDVHYNVILLPIQGDPYAPAMYWDWTRVTSGTFLSPAAEWP